MSAGEIIALIACFIGSSFFSGSEAVLMSLGIDRARQLIDEGGARGRAMEFMVSSPNELLTTILIGNNVANILASALTTTIATRYFENDAISISVGVTTFIILIFGEIIPKTFARNHAEGLSTPVIRILQACLYLIYPLVKATVFLIHNLLGSNAQLRGRIVTSDDIEYFLSKAEEENSIDSKQLEMLNSILEFPTIKVKDIMVPRNQVVSIPCETKYKDVIELIKEDTFSRYPVVDGELENTLGLIHVKDISFFSLDDRENFNIKKHLKTPFFVYEHMKVQAVFDHMNRRKLHMALVKDENGIVVGVITLEDIIEEILGEIQDEHDDEESGLIKTEEIDLESGILVTGYLSLRDLYNEFNIKIPLNDNYSTLAGFLLDMLGNNFPEEGQMMMWEGYSFELTGVENSEIKEVKIKDVDGEKHLFSKTEAHSRAAKNKRPPEENS